MKALVIAGPTAAGKTLLSLELAKLGFEIISYDSVQVYRYLDIGSCKPTRDEQERVPHHLIDIVDPDYPFSTGDFIMRSKEAVAEIVSRNKIPLFVGGTGLYIDSLMKGISDIPPVEQAIRERLSEEVQSRGLSSLYSELKAADPVFAAKISEKDTQRIIRGVEVFRAHGQPITSFFNSKAGLSSNSTLYVGLNDERAILYERINRRVETMLAQGLVDEVVSLREQGYGPDLKSMRSIGYQQVHQYLDNFFIYEEMVESIKKTSRNYAKRQLTWFRRNKEIQWFTIADKAAIKKTVCAWLNGQ